jgi:hypothetical protein
MTHSQGGNIMKSKALNNLMELWTGKMKVGQGKEAPSESMVGAPLQIHPLTIGFRVDVSVPTGTRSEAEASQFIWVSPAGSLRSVKALKVLLFPN